MIRWGSVRAVGKGGLGVGQRRGWEAGGKRRGGGRGGGGGKCV